MDAKRKAEEMYYEMRNLQGRGITLYGCWNDRVLAQCLLILEMQKKLLLENLTPFINLDLGARLLDDGLRELDEIECNLKGIHYQEKSQINK